MNKTTKLLIITQKVDVNDDLLGFFHRWIEKLAQHFEKVLVICLQKGKYYLPEKVKVLSLGKESGRSKLKYLYRFYLYILKEKKNYDVVFVHMNSIYILLGWFFWRIFGKKIYFWYNHHFGSLITKIAILLVKNVFYTSPFSFASKFKNSLKMPAGIDVDLFKKDFKIPKTPNSILFLGRISPIKKVDILIEAANLLDKENINFVLNIVGEPGEKDKEYFEKIKNLAKNLKEKGEIKFLGKVPNYKTPEIYNQNEVMVNLSPSGLFDKTVLEAMACETLVLVSSNAFKEILPDFLIFEEKNPIDLKNKIINIFKMENEKKEILGKKFREWVNQNHNLDVLVEKLKNEFIK